MAKVEQRVMRLTNPLTRNGEIELELSIGALMDAGYVVADFEASGSVGVFLWERREEGGRRKRRADRRAGLEPELNRPKSLLPAGWRIISPDDPRLKDDPTPDPAPVAD